MWRSSSPRSSESEVLAKIGGWLAAGTRLAWLIDPRKREARIFTADGDVSVIGEDASLDGGDVVPGFSRPLRSVFLNA